MESPIEIMYLLRRF